MDETLEKIERWTFSYEAPPKQMLARGTADPRSGARVPMPNFLQQLLLNIFRDAFPQVIESESFPQILQEVKRDLFARDFSQAFGTSEHLDVYAVRWSPSRALCYQSIFVEVIDNLADIFKSSWPYKTDRKPKAESQDEAPPRVLCIGGGAAEVVAFAGFIDYFKVHHYWGKREEKDSALFSSQPLLDLHLVDLAKWQPVVDRLNQCLTSPPVPPKYSRAAITDENSPLLSVTDMKVHFLKHDILTLNSSQLADMLGPEPALITFLFTLNELYKSSVSKTSAFLLNLTLVAKPGSILVVIDSPGSYSYTSIGSRTKAYPMHWLLNYCLLRQSNELKDSSPMWAKLLTEESKWFRIPKILKYPIPLEDMRYQIHIYKRL